VLALIAPDLLFTVINCLAETHFCGGICHASPVLVGKIMVGFFRKLDEAVQCQSPFAMRQVFNAIDVLPVRFVRIGK
jgi:hypothetical protein